MSSIRSMNIWISEAAFLRLIQISEETEIDMDELAERAVEEFALDYFIESDDDPAKELE